jgi:hypothetical protein
MRLLFESTPKKKRSEIIRNVLTILGNKNNIYIFSLQ